MPKLRESVTVAKDDKYETIQSDVKVREKQVPTQYRKPLNYDVFMSLVQGASASPGVDFKWLFPITEREADATMSQRDLVLNLFVNALDKWARADVYESVASESTIVTIAGERLDLMSLPVKNLIKGYNGHRDQVEVRAQLQIAKGVDAETAQAEAEKGVGFGPWRKVAKNLTQGYDKDGTRIAPAAKLNEEGELVAIG